MGCKGVCLKYKVKKPRFQGIGRYASGHKRCSTCEIFLDWDGNSCPCCHFSLRTKPRNTNNRKKLQLDLMIKRI